MSASRKMRLDTDAAGDVRVIAIDVAREARKRVLDPVADRVRTWRANPRCAHCGEVILDVGTCALVPSEIKGATPRVAHRTQRDADGHYCVVRALMAVNPTLNTRRAAERAGE